MWAFNSEQFAKHEKAIGKTALLITIDLYSSKNLKNESISI